MRPATPARLSFSLDGPLSDFFEDEDDPDASDLELSLVNAPAWLQIDDEGNLTNSALKYSLEDAPAGLGRNITPLDKSGNVYTYAVYDGAKKQGDETQLLSFDSATGHLTYSTTLARNHGDGSGVDGDGNQVVLTVRASQERGVVNPATTDVVRPAFRPCCKNNKRS